MGGVGLGGLVLLLSVSSEGGLVRWGGSLRGMV